MRKHKIKVHNTAPVIEAEVIETPVIPEVKPSLFSRVKARVKTFFSRKTATPATGRSVWSKLWTALKALVQKVVVRPAKAVGGFFARIARKVASFGRKVASTKAFKAAHFYVRAVLAGTLLSVWLTAFLVNPLVTAAYSLGGYLLAEVIGAGLLKLRDLREQGSRAAHITLRVLNVTARAVYVGMQIVMVGLLAATAIAVPAFGLLIVASYGIGLWIDMRVEREAFVARWREGTCEACAEKTLVNVMGICMECRRLQVQEDTDPFVKGHGPLATAVG